VTALNIQTPRVFLPLLEPARYKGAWGGRGSGKSHFFAEMAVEHCLLNPGSRLVCVREVQRSLAQSVKRLIDDKIQALGVSSMFDSKESEIKTPGDGLIIFQGMQNHTADSIKSLEGYSIAWVEEAQSLSQRSLDLLRPTIRMPGSELWFSWNPDQASDPVDQLLRGESPPPDSRVVRVNYEDNPWFPDVLRAEMEYDRRASDPAKYAHIWLGEYRRAGDALVIRNWKVEEFDSDPGATYRYGADWGFSIDPSVLVRCYMKGRQLFVDYEAYEVGCEIDRLPDLFARVPQAEKWPITADSARPETISYLQRHGYPRIHPAIKGARSLEEGVEFLQSFEIVVHPRCQHTIDELATYAYALDPDTGKPIPKLEDKNNHVIDALRYACEAVRRAGTNAKPKPIVYPNLGMPRR
jgi:phage terminase large subunit